MNTKDKKLILWCMVITIWMLHSLNVQKQIDINTKKVQQLEEAIIKVQYK